MRVCFSNLGCKLNQAELEHLAREFSDAGHSVTRDPAEADVHVVNSCTVTHAAARDSRKLVRRTRRLNPSLRTVLTGCYAAENETEARRATRADLIVTNADKDHLLARVEAAFPDLRRARPAAATPEPLPYAPIEFGHSRALVKIEDGCNMHCSFCIIPTTRGAQRSRQAAEVVSEVDRLVDAGFPEVVLTGVQISAYRHGGLGLYDLTARVLDQTAVERLRLTSIAPWHFDRRLLDLFESGRLCRHVHLSLQSGSTPTLARMRRPYAAAEFRDLVGAIRARVGGVAITTDVIAGFPGETEEEFEDSLSFVEEIGFARVHVFPYSVRPGTEAAAFERQMPPETKKARVRRLLAAADRSERAFIDNQLGLEAETLWECRKDGLWHGTTDNYIRVRAASDENLLRRLTRSVLSRRSGLVARTRIESAGAAGAEHAA